MEYYQADILCTNKSDVDIVSALLQNMKVDSVWEQEDKLIAVDLKFNYIG